MGLGIAVQHEDRRALAAHAEIDRNAVDFTALQGKTFEHQILLPVDGNVMVRGIKCLIAGLFPPKS